MALKPSNRVITQIAIPVLLTILLFIVTIQFIVIPTIEDSKLSSKKRMIHELVDITEDLIIYYHQREISGELTREVAKSRAIDKVRSLRYGPESNEFFWIADLNKNIVMHPHFTEAEDKDASIFIECDGIELLERFEATIRENGKGYIEYMGHSQYETNKIVHKIAAIKGFEPWNWIIVTGISLEEIDKELLEIKKKLYTAISIIFVLILIVSVYIFMYGRRMEINRLKVEKKFSDSEKKYKDLFNNSLIGIYQTTEDGKINIANPALINMLGYGSLDEMNQLNLENDKNFEKGYSRKLFKEQIEKEGRIIGRDSKWKKKDGTILYIRENAQIVYDEINNIKCYEGTVEDITTQKRVEQDLLATNEELKATTDALQESNNELKIALEQARKSKELVLANEKLNRNEKILLKAHEDINKQKTELERLNRELKDNQEETQQLNEELSAINEHLFIQKEELETTLEKLKETQSQLVQSEKMASVGVLTSGIAHEINNPLNFIQGGKLALENYIKDHLKDHLKDVQPMIEIIDTGVSRASNIVKSLNRFNRKSDKNVENCDIHFVIDNCLVMLHNQLKYRIEVKKNFTNETFSVTGNEGKLHQVFINILTNAEQAIEKEGSIEISTSIEQNHLKISIKDSGCGISKINLPKITDPFFTTKDPGKGTGLGLSITYQIIQEHNGSLNYISTEGMGTTAIIKLPIKE